MKKLLVLALTLVIVLSLSACGENNTNDGASSNNNSDSLISDIMPDTSNGMTNSDDMTLENSTATDTKISKDEALKIALNSAGVEKENATDLDIELDRENGQAIWDIDFESGNTEYSYDINADTGDIEKQENEPRD